MIKKNLIELWFIFVIVFEWREIGAGWQLLVYICIDVGDQFNKMECGISNRHIMWLSHPRTWMSTAYVVVIGLRFHILWLSHPRTWMSSGICCGHWSQVLCVGIGGVVDTVLKLSHNSTCGSWYMRIIRGISFAVTSWQNNVVL